MNSVNITFENGEVKSFPSFMTYYDIIKSQKLEKEVIGVIVNDKVSNLGDKPTGDTAIKYARLSDTNGSRMYEAGLRMLIEYAAKKILPELVVCFTYDLPHGLVVEFKTTDILSKETRQKIIQEMKKAVQDNLVIKKLYLKSYEGIKYYKKNKNRIKEKNIQNIIDDTIVLYQLGDLINYYYYEMPYTMGIIDKYDIKWIDNNRAVVTFPTMYDSNNKSEQVTSDDNYRLIMDAYKNGQSWLELLRVPYINNINDLITRGKIEDFVRTSELAFNLEINMTAKEIASDENIKCILLAGPSSSGKTTVTKRLADYLRIFGKEPIVISIDDYFKERVDTPKDADGNYDFECPEATDNDYLTKDVQRLLNGEEVQLPIFNFVTGKKELKGPKIKLRENTLLLFEGLHAINPKTLPFIDEKVKYRIFISPYNPLCIDEQNYISTEDLRLLRRIVRDFRTRGYSVVSSLESWGRVRSGEEKYILPLVSNANKIINTSLPYEVGVLKVMVSPLLFSVPISSPWYGEARRLLSFLKQFFTINSEYVPKDSILREFIGGNND